MQLLQFVIMASVISSMRFQTADASTPVCAGSAWKIQGDRCYRYLPYNSTRQNYQYANFERECEKLGGELARIDNAKQNAFVRSMVPRSGGHGSGKRQVIMIGLNDVITEGEFKWADGTTPVYFNWDDGQPDNSEVSNRKDGEDCVVMRIDNGKWNDMHCGSYYDQADLAKHKWTWWDDTTHFICSANAISNNYKAQGQGWCGTAGNLALPALTTETDQPHLQLQRLCDDYKECLGFDVQGPYKFLRFSSAQAVPEPPSGWSKNLGRELKWCQSNCKIEKVFPDMEAKCWVKTHVAVKTSSTTTTTTTTTTPATTGTTTAITTTPPATTPATTTAAPATTAGTTTKRMLRPVLTPTNDPAATTTPVDHLRKGVSSGSLLTISGVTIVMITAMI